MEDSTVTRMAILGTIAELHRESLAYDVACLRAIVTQLAPDLLCAEITRDAWEHGDLDAAALEVREALAPVVAGTDVVLLPVAPTPQRFADFTPRAGWRHDLGQSFASSLRWGMRRASRPEAINGPVFGAYCHLVCMLTEWTWPGEYRAAWEAQNQGLAGNILAAVRRDPGRRVLVTAQCQRLHRLVPFLRAQADVNIVDYREL